MTFPLAKPILILSSLSLLFSGTAKPELLSNDDPSKYMIAKDVLWASPRGFDLTMDIYTPNSGKDSYPVVVIFHGGGWLIRNKSIMDQMSKYLVTNSEYVVCNVNYRLLADEGNTINLNQIIEDVFEDKKIGEWMKNLEPEDLLKYGLIPEFIGRLPITATLEDLDEKSLIKILQEPKNSLIKQYQELSLIHI